MSLISFLKASKKNILATCVGFFSFILTISHAFSSELETPVVKKADAYWVGNGTSQDLQINLTVQHPSCAEKPHYFLNLDGCLTTYPLKCAVTLYIETKSFCSGPEVRTQIILSGRENSSLNKMAGGIDEFSEARMHFTSHNENNDEVFFQVPAL